MPDSRIRDFGGHNENGARKSGPKASLRKERLEPWCVTTPASALIANLRSMVRRSSAGGIGDLLWVRQESTGLCRRACLLDFTHFPIERTLQSILQLLQ
jgi:hypothetical protein